jgi:anti-sigma factor RsiW
MYQHPTEQQLMEYKRRSLAPDAFLVVHGHVSECARCAARCYEPGQARADHKTLLSALTVNGGERPFHLTGELMSGYAADELDEIDLEAAATHLEVCAECAASIARLRAAREVSAPERAFASSTPVASAAPARAGRRWQLRPVHPRLVRPLQLAAAVLVLAVLLGAAWLLFRSRNAQTPQLAGQETPPAQANETPLPANNVPAAPSPQPEPTREQQPAQVLVALNDSGRQVTLDAQGNLAGLEQLPEELRAQVKSALVTQRLSRPPALDDLNSEAGVLRGGGEGSGPSFQLLAPLDVVIESDRPTFRWRPLAGAESYNVTVTDDSLNEVAASGPLTATDWRVSRPLARGRVYSWQVTARKRDGQAVTSPVLPAPPAKFQVLAQKRLRELRDARKLYPDSHLTLGVLYAQAGLLDDAAREFQALARVNPRAEVARKLLGEVRALSARRRSG